MRLKFMVIVLIGFSSSAGARWLSQKESPSVVTRLYFDYLVKKDGAYTQTVEYRVKVQSDDAKVNASVFTIDYNSVTDRVEVLEAYTQNGSQKFKVEASAIEDRDKGDSRDYDTLKVRSVVYPQVQVGSELFVRYRITTARSVIKDRWSAQMSFMPSVHVTDLRVRVESEVPLYFDLRDPRKMLSYKVPSPKRFELTNRKPLPGWVHAEKDPYFHPQGFAELWISTHQNWGEFLSGLEADYRQVLAEPLPKKLAAWLKPIARLKSPEDKIRSLMAKMSEEFRYFGDWRRHNGGYVPRHLREIEASRYGDCKDLSTLLVALLRELKIDARVALIRRGENPWGREPDYKLPATGRFNHAIVVAKVGGHSYWLDPTNPVTSLKPYPDISGRPAWVMGVSGAGEFEVLPEAVPEDFAHIHHYAYRFNSTDDVKVEVRAELKNLAPYRMANELMLTPRSQVLSSTLEYFSEGHEVHEFKYKTEPKTGRILSDMRVDLDYTAGQVAYNTGSARFLVIPDGFLEGAFYETRGRESDLRLSDSPFTFRGVRRLVRTRLAQEAPAPCKVDSKWMSVERSVRAEGRDVVIDQFVKLKRPFITRDELQSEPFKALQRQTRTCFHRAGVLIEPSH